jgi:abequosyltransferase
VVNIDYNMDLSFNIPTYNRCKFLKKNVEELIIQVRNLKVVSSVEINISDNCSIDGTERCVQNIINANSDINITYSKNERNLGPDENYIKAMKMAHGNYSILLGDDDFLKQNGLNLILKTIKSYKEIAIFFFSRTNVDSNGLKIGDQLFFKKNMQTHVFDFSNWESGKSYFSSIISLGGSGSFISSVIYKTRIVNESEYDHSFTGTKYSFFYYWWGSLLRGSLLMCTNQSFINSTVRGFINKNFGSSIDRVLVDYIGYQKVADLMFKGSPYYDDFSTLPNVDHDVFSLGNIYLRKPKRFKEELEPCLLKGGWSLNFLVSFYKNYSLFQLVKNVVKKIK